MILPLIFIHTSIVCTYQAKGPSSGRNKYMGNIGRNRVCCLSPRTGALSVLPDISGARQVSTVVTQPPSRVREHDPKARVNCCQSKNLGLELPEPIGTVIWNRLTERWFSFPALGRSNERLERAHVGVLPRKQTAHSK